MWISWESADASWLTWPARTNATLDYYVTLSPRLRTHWPMLCNQPVMTATWGWAVWGRNRRQRLSCSGECQRPTVKVAQWRTKYETDAIQRTEELKSPSMNIRSDKYLFIVKRFCNFKMYIYKFITGRSWLSACKRQRNKLRLWTPNVLLWRRPNRDSRVRWRTHDWCGESQFSGCQPCTRSRGTLTR